MTQSKLWTKNFLIDSAVNFLVYLVYYLLMVIVASYSIDKLHASVSQAGLAAGIFIVGGLVSRIFAGKSIEQIGRKKMLYIGLSVYLIITLLYFKEVSLGLFFIIRFLHGIGFGISSTATGTIIANIIPHERRGEGISYYAMSTTLASAIGPFLGLYLIQHTDFYMIIIFCSFLSAVSLCIAFFLSVAEIELTKEMLDNMKRFTLGNFIEYKAVPIAAIGAIAGFSYSSIISFLSSYTKEIDLVAAGSFFFIVYSAVILISRPLTGRLFDSKGENYVMYPSFAMFAIGLVVISQAHHAITLLLSGALIGFGFGTFLSGGQAIAVKLSPSHRIGLATSTFFSAADLGVGIGPFFLGFLVPATGFRGVYMCMAGLILAAMLLYYFLHEHFAESKKLPFQTLYTDEADT